MSHLLMGHIGGQKPEMGQKRRIIITITLSLPSALWNVHHPLVDKLTLKIRCFLYRRGRRLFQLRQPHSRLPALHQISDEVSK